MRWAVDGSRADPIGWLPAKRRSLQKYNKETQRTKFIKQHFALSPRFTILLQSAHSNPPREDGYMRKKNVVQKIAKRKISR